MKVHAKEAVKTLSDDGENLTMNQFLTVCGKKPWRNLLPDAQRDAMILLSAETAAESPRSPGSEAKTAAVKDSRRQLLSSIRKLFNEADVNENGERRE